MLNVIFAFISRQKYCKLAVKPLDMKTKFFLILFLITSSLFSQTTLSAGDIAILQYNADGSPEVIKFLALAPMESGTIINFTDNGWKSDNTFRSNEGVDIWTAPSNIACGDVITFTFTNIALGTNGDQILAYQGDAISPTFIFAINSQGSATWQTTANNGQSSALPTGLTNGTSAIAITEIDNAKYDSSTLSGTKSAILGAICSNANWGGSNTTTQTFTGSFTSEINWNTSWSGTGTPSDYFKAVIHENYDTSTDGTFTACELQINSSRTLTVNSGDTITIENGITNNGAVVVEDNASIVQLIPDGPNTGTDYTVERESTSQPEEGNYTYWSSPLTSSTLANVTNAQLYYLFTASSQSWASANSSTSMTPGIGYINTGDSGISYPNTYTASFSGSAFNNGDVSVTLGFTADADPETDWNLLGNPYPSAIDADTFIADNTTIGGTLYFWTHNTLDSAGDNTQDDYVSWNGTGGTAGCTGCTAPDGNIASGQGFFAQALSAGNATFTNSMRVTGGNTNFYRASAKKQAARQTQKDRVWIDLSSETSFSQILIGFLDDATDGIDRRYDGVRFIGSAKANLYSLINEPYAIQGKSSLKKKEKIPLGFSASESGNYKISINNLEGNLTKSKLFLKDNLLDVTHRLDKNDYEFSVSETGEFNNRFELIIKSKSKIKNTKNPKKNIIVFAKNNTIHVKSVKEKIKFISVYNLYGKQIKRVVRNKNHVTFKLKSKNSKKMFLLKIQLSNGKVITKKIIK